MRVRNASALAQVLAWPNNLVSLARIAIVSALIGALYNGMAISPAIGIGVFVAGYWLLDQIDGVIARRLGKGSSFGESLDLMADRWCDVLVVAYLLQSAPAHTGALVAFLLLRIAPEVCVSRYVGTASHMFLAAATLDPTSAITRRLAYWLLEIGFVLRTGFFAWALFGSAPTWAGLAIVLPAVAFMALVLRVLARHARDVLSARAGG
jgi:phosphatidylglycerophosphate synthase